MIPKALMHKFFTRLTTVAMLTIALSGTEIRADRTKLDPSTGLIMTGDWELVRDNCAACHVAKLITQRQHIRVDFAGEIDSDRLWTIFTPSGRTSCV